MHGPLKKKLRTEKDFMAFDTVSSPKPLFFRKAKGSTAPSPGPTLQVLAPHCYSPHSPTADSRGSAGAPLLHPDPSPLQPTSSLGCCPWPTGPRSGSQAGLRQTEGLARELKVLLLYISTTWGSSSNSRV